MGNASNQEDWLVECSDEELYDVANNLIIPFNQPGGTKLWEPSGLKISSLYKQIETSNFVELKWICPEKRSSSDHSNNSVDKSKIAEPNESKPSSMEPNQFDFDEEQPEKYNDFPKAGPKRRNNQGQRKVTKLDKVLNDMKKYQDDFSHLSNT